MPRRFRDDRASGECPFCGEPATRIVELQVSEKPPTGSRNMRGTRLGGTSKRVCNRHAEMFFNALKTPKRRPKDLQQRRVTDIEGAE